MAKAMAHEAGVRSSVSSTALQSAYGRRRPHHRTFSGSCARPRPKKVARSVHQGDRRAIAAPQRHAVRFTGFSSALTSTGATPSTSRGISGVVNELLIQIPVVRHSDGPQAFAGWWIDC
jgi:hypothetical protein